MAPGQQSKGIGVAILPEPVPPSGDNWPQPDDQPIGAPISPYSNYHVPSGIQPPPPLLFDSSKLYVPPPVVKEMRRAQRLRVALASVIVLLLMMVGFGAFTYAHANNHAASTSGGELGSSRPVTGTNASCVLPNVDHNAAKNFASAQMTSGLRDISHKNFVPVDNTTIFTVGQTVYFAFTVGTNAIATLSADWCWGSAGTTSHYQLSVDQNQGVQGYFNLHNLGAAAVGTGVLVVRWNDAVAYATLFAVNN